jgi:recombination protein RecT
MLAANADALHEALARHVDPDRLIRVSLAQIRKSPGLAKCSPVSLAQAIMEAGRLGVEPGLLGQAYLVPYKGEATLIVGYRGLVGLARRSGDVTKVEARIVHEHDAFEVEFGSSARFSHRPNLFGDRGKPIGVYAEATYADAAGTVQREFMTIAEVEAIRARSKAAHSGPWVTDWAEMAKKTAVRRLAKMLPLSIEDAAAIDRLDELEFGSRDSRKVAAAVDVESIYTTADASDDAHAASVEDYEAMPVGDA